MNQTKPSMRAGTAILICLAVLGCKAREKPANSAEPAAGAATLAGTWTTIQPVTFSGEGLRTETSDGRTTYREGGGFDYTGKLRIAGEKLPPAGLTFTISGTGKWAKDGNTLRERFSDVKLTPASPNAPIDKLATALAGEMAARPPSEAEIVELTSNSLTLRDRATGETASYARAVEEVK